MYQQTILQIDKTYYKPINIPYKQHINETSRLSIDHRKNNNTQNIYQLDINYDHINYKPNKVLNYSQQIYNKKHPDKLINPKIKYLSTRTRE